MRMSRINIETLPLPPVSPLGFGAILPVATFGSPMARQAVIILIIVLVFGVLVPWYRGLTFLDSITIIVYACISLLFVAPPTAEMFGVPASKFSRADILSRTGVILAYGCGISVLMLASGILTVNLSNWQGRLLVPRVTLLLSALLLGVTASAATVFGTAILALHFGAGRTKTILRVVFLLLLLAWYFYGYPHLTTSGIQQLALLASGVFTIMAIILLVVLQRISTASLDAAPNESGPSEGVQPAP